jgi:uncharacterized protein YkuJ
MRHAPLKRGKLTAREKAVIAELAAEGWKPSRIAVRLNRHRATINFHMVTNGLRAPEPRTFSFERNGVKVVSFSEEEDLFIHVLRIQDLPLQTIATAASNRFGHQRSRESISVRLRMLASRETVAER